VREIGFDIKGHASMTARNPWEKTTLEPGGHVTATTTAPAPAAPDNDDPEAVPLDAEWRASARAGTRWWTDDEWEPLLKIVAALTEKAKERGGPFGYQ
jgi:hypothetical protein